MKHLKTLVENLVEAELSTINTPVIYFDMDGVLAGFDKGVEAATGGGTNKIKNTYMALMQNFPELQKLGDDELKARLAGPQADPGLKALKKAWQAYRQQKFMVAGREGFFLNLPVLPGAVEMVQKATAMTGKKPGVLTAPIDGDKARCEQEKHAWIEKHFPGMFDSFHCTQEKQAYANADAILIDDRTKYTSKFEAAGGTAILHKNPADTLQKLENLLRSKGVPV